LDDNVFAVVAVAQTPPSHAATSSRWMVVHRDGALRLIETDGASIAK